jgi:hypothetical protein
MVKRDGHNRPFDSLHSLGVLHVICYFDLLKLLLLIHSFGDC